MEKCKFWINQPEEKYKYAHLCLYTYGRFMFGTKKKSGIEIYNELIVSFLEKKSIPNINK